MRDHTFEPLTLTPDGRRLYVGVEAPLAQDGDYHGRNLIRIQSYTGTSGGAYRPGAQYAFLTGEGLNLVELVALDDHRLLALERQYSKGVGNAIRVQEIDVGKAMDVSHVESLFQKPSYYQAPSSLLFDLTKCPAGPPGAVKAAPDQVNPLLDNVEGMALGPELQSGPYRGRRLLLMVSDDNDSADQVTRLYALAVRPLKTVD